MESNQTFAEHVVEQYLEGTDFSQSRTKQVYGKMLSCPICLSQGSHKMDCQNRAYVEQETKMGFNEYQKEAEKTAVFTHDYYPFASLMIEAAEFCDLVTKQQLRGDNKGLWPDDLKAEAGDVLWNLAVACAQYEVSLQDVADYNIQKLRDRQARGVIKGDGDNR